MDILKSNAAISCPASAVPIVAHILGTGVNPVGVLAGRMEVVKYLDSAGTGSGALKTGVKAYEYADAADHETSVAYIACHDVPNMRIRAYKTSMSDGSHTNEALAAVLAYAKAHPGARHIVNMSFGADYPAGEENTYVKAQHDLIRQLIAANVAVVAAAGNSRQWETNNYPACFDEVICVAGINPDGSVADLSSWMDGVDFCDLCQQVPAIGNTGKSTTRNGTSFAAPIVCNKLAKIWCGAPALTEAQLYEAAKANALDLGAGGYDEHCGWGWIASVDAAESDTPPSNPVSDEDGAENDEPAADETRLLYLATPRMTGPDVYALEIALESLGYDCKMSNNEKTSKVGIFGPACDAAVRAFQAAKGLAANGIVDVKTREALTAAASSPTFEEQLAAWAKTQVGNIYVWGAQGENLTDMTDEADRALKAKTPEAWIRGMEEEDRNYVRALAFYKKKLAAGQKPILAYDCGGLIVHWLHIVNLLDMNDDLSSRGLYRACTPIARTELKPGNLLFRDNGVKIHHVGVYVGGNRVVEAMGRDQGVVMRDINAGGAGYWTDYGVLKLLK